MSAAPREIATSCIVNISDISKNKSNVSGAAKHFSQTHRGALEFFSFYGIENVEKPVWGGDWQHQVVLREAYWVFNLQTCSPSGFNLKTDLR